MARFVALGLAAVALAGCAVRQIPLSPALEPIVDDETPKASGQVVALVMDERVSAFRRERDFSLTQSERYDSGQHFMRSLLAQLRARGVQVIEVETRQQGEALGVPYVLIPDAPGVSVIRPKGLLDFSFLGSINRVNVSYSVRMLKNGARVPERVAGGGSRTASFFWSNAMLQTLGLVVLGFSVSVAIYALWLGVTVATNYQASRQVQSTAAAVVDAIVNIPPPVAISVFIADQLVSQITAQVIPRVINPLVDILINEPRWESMVQSAHDDAAAELANAIARKLSGAPAAEAK